MKMSGLPSVLSAFRSKMALLGKPRGQETPADPRALVGANDTLTGLPGLTAFEGTLAQAVRLV